MAQAQAEIDACLERYLRGPAGQGCEPASSSQGPIQGTPPEKTAEEEEKDPTRLEEGPTEEEASGSGKRSRRS